MSARERYCWFHQWGAPIITDLGLGRFLEQQTCPRCGKQRGHVEGRDDGR